MIKSGKAFGGLFPFTQRCVITDYHAYASPPTPIYVVYNCSKDEIEYPFGESIFSVPFGDYVIASYASIKLLSDESTNVCTSITGSYNGYLGTTQEVTDDVGVSQSGSIVGDYVPFVSATHVDYSVDEDEGSNNIGAISGVYYTIPSGHVDENNDDEGSCNAGIIAGIYSLVGGIPSIIQYDSQAESGLSIFGVFDGSNDDYVDPEPELGDEFYPSIGDITLFPGSAPSGWLTCDGSAVNRTTYSGLFSAIGTTYGVGDGVNTFNLPDMRSRVPIASSPGGLTGGRLTERISGSVGGKETHVISTPEMPSHSHTGIYASLSYAGAGSVTPPHYSMVDHNGLFGIGVIDGSYTGNTGGGQSHNNMPPFIVIEQWIIKT